MDEFIVDDAWAHDWDDHHDWDDYAAAEAFELEMAALNADLDFADFPSDITRTVAESTAAAHAQARFKQPLAQRYTNADTYNPRLQRTREEPGRWPALEQAYRYGRGPRIEPRGLMPTLKYMYDMRTEHGTLVFLTLMQPDADRFSLFTAEGRTGLVSESRADFGAFLSVRGKGCQALTAAIHRGKLWGITHTHAVVHLSALSRPLQSMLLVAPAGPGGGTYLTTGTHGEAEVHGVIMGDEQEDMERVAAYLCAFPDGRAKLDVNNDQHMDMLEEIAQAEKNTVKLAYRLQKGWKPGRPL